jgi:hypothetical protein
MSFNNPYMNKPDWGQGIQDLVQQLLPILMMNKMYKEPGAPQQGQPGRQGSMLPQGPQQGLPMSMGTPGSAGTSSNPQKIMGGNMTMGMPKQMDPQMMQKIMAILRMMGGGAMGGGM